MFLLYPLYTHLSTFPRISIIIDMNMKAKEQIKSLLAAKNIKMKELCLLISEKMGKDYSSNNLPNKLIRGSITYNEVLLIADILGYKITFVDTEEI